MADETLDLQVRLTPRASAERVVLMEDGSLAVRVSAPPVDGRANDALIRAVADALGLAPSRVRLVRGARSRTKTLRISGSDLERRVARLGGPR
jgi:uncharacterized protein (TIGR00251 family)